MTDFLVIGIGRMGSIHAKNLYKGRVRGARLKAVCDTDADVRAAFKAAHPDVEVYSDYREAAEKSGVNAAIIATPHYSHTEIAEYCITRGINVLSEKPQTVTVGEARRMNEVAEKRSDVLYAIMYNQRTNRMYAYAKKLMDKGALGELRRVTLIVTDWYRSQFYYDMGGWRASWNGEGGGLLINQCVHQLDVLQWLVGLPESLIAVAKTVNRNITVENDVAVIMKYPGGATGEFVASGHEPRGTNRLEIAGDKGKIVIDKHKMLYIAYEKSEREINTTVTKGYGSTRVKKTRVTYGAIRKLTDLVYGQQLRVVKRFADVLNGKAAEPTAYGREGVRALEFINAVYLSAYSGKEVGFPVDAGEYDELIEKLKEEEKKHVRKL